MFTLGGKQEVSHQESSFSDCGCEASPNKGTRLTPQARSALAPKGLCRMYSASGRHRLSSNPITSTPSLSCFVHGLLTVVAQLLNGQSLSFGRLFPTDINRFRHSALLNSS